MKWSVCAIFDKKLGVYERPVVVRMNGEVIREWDILRKDSNTKYGKNPEDFDLFQIGTYDDEVGSIETPHPKVHLATGV